MADLGPEDGTLRFAGSPPQLADLPMRTVDVTTTIVATPLAPQVEKLIP